MERKDLVI